MGARRALGRWGWRLLRIEWRQQLLVLALITTSLTVASVLATFGFHADQPASTFTGSASHRLYLDAHGADTLESQLDEVDSSFGAANVTLKSTGRRDGTTTEIAIESLPPTTPFGADVVRLQRGRLPVRADELALSTDLASSERLWLNDVVSINGSTFKIVGLVEDPSIIRRPFAVVQHISVEEAVGAIVLVSATRRQIDEFNSDADGNADFSNTERLQFDGGDRTMPLVASLTLTAILLLEISLLCSAGFVVLAQRRMRQYGLMGAIGASPTHLRTALRLNGAVLGVVGGAIGTGLGFALSLAVRPLFEQLLNHRIETWSMPWIIVIPLIGMSGGTGLLAAWWPARSLSTLSTVDALASRPTQTASAARWLRAGIPCVLAGTVALAVAAEAGKAKISVIALLVALGGILATTPACAAAAGRVAARLPVGPRIALREVARHPNRSAAALASLVIALVIPSVITLVTASNDIGQGRTGPNLPDNWVLVMPESSFGGHALSSARELTERDLDAITDALPESTSVAIHLPATKASSFPLQVGRCSGDETEQTCTGLSGDQPWVATPELAAALGLDPSLAESDADLLGATSEPVHLMRRDGPGFQSVKPELAELGSFTAVPNFFVPASALSRTGLVSLHAGWLIVNPTPITAMQRSHLLNAASAQDMRGRLDLDALRIELEQPPNDDSDVRRNTTIVGAALALAVVASMTALLRIDSQRTERTLVAIGADRHVQRSIAASTTAFLAFVAAALALPSAYLVLLALSSDQSVTFPIIRPTAHLVVLLIGIPLFATTASALLTHDNKMG